MQRRNAVTQCGIMFAMMTKLMSSMAYSRRATAKALAATLALTLIGFVYWPVTHAGFVWVDKIIFHDNAWLRYGDAWKGLIFRNFYEWINYFRPLAVALFTLEVRTFDAAPGPMHLISLGLHLANTSLVAMLAISLTPGVRLCPKRLLPVGIASLIYGLHPALIEPVVWICSQADLLVTFFVLAGLLLNIHIRHVVARSMCVAACFFLAACTKESAIAFPFLLVLFDWVRHGVDAQPRNRALPSMMQMARRQWLTYAAMILAGVAYLALRHWALGVLVRPIGHTRLFSVEYFQTMGFVYLTYWRILLWPMIGLGPVHEIDARQFAQINGASILCDAASVVIFAWGVRAAWKRSPIGALFFGFTLGLLPALHVIPVAFDDSLYHERYAMLGIAITCAWLPTVVAASAPKISTMRSVSLAGLIITAGWLGLAAANIRVTLPLWSDEVTLWQWVLRDNPGSIRAKDHLLSTYLERGDLVRAQALADEFIADESACASCLLSAANLALAKQDSERATVALKKAKEALPKTSNLRLLQSFVLATGQLREMQHDVPGAEEAYRDAIELEPAEPVAQMSLALLLARQGRTTQAREAAAQAEKLFAPDDRAQQREAFEKVLAASTAGASR